MARGVKWGELFGEREREGGREGGVGEKWLGVPGSKGRGGETIPSVDIICISVVFFYHHHSVTVVEVPIAL